MLLESVQPPGFTMHRSKRDEHLSGKRKGGGVCFIINDSWCDHNNIQELKSFCSPDLEFLIIKYRPYYLPREFSSVIVTAAYIPPQADTMMALKELHWTLCNWKPYIRGCIYCSWGFKQSKFENKATYILSAY
jgi:hypothetical protein